MHGGASVLPSDPWKVFEAEDPSSGNIIRFKLLPIVFNLPERATHTTPNLFVVVEGWLEFRLDSMRNNSELLTHGFSTKAAYFRKTSGGVAHVYGAHFDFALDELGHPIFHAQMKSFQDLYSYVDAEFQVGGELTDNVKGILKNVRLPTAQMDCFSFFLQLCADHLLYDQSGPEERGAFNSLLNMGEFLKGAGYQSGRLTAASATSCYRSRHWYPVKI